MVSTAAMRVRISDRLASRAARLVAICDWAAEALSASRR
jgi:hypothetical protein